VARTSRPLTRFGKTVRDLMESRGIYGWTELTEVLNEAGWDGSRPTLSHWVYGVHPADYKMLRYLVKALELTEDEQQRLAWEFAFGQWPEPPRKKSA
jgi:hypothetical protein